MSGRGSEDRRAAMAYLQTATRADRAGERNALRRRAAELILPRRGSSTGPEDGEEAASQESPPDRPVRGKNLS